MFWVYKDIKYIKNVKKNFNAKNHTVRKETTILNKKLILSYGANIKVYIVKNIIVLKAL